MTCPSPPSPTRSAALLKTSNDLRKVLERRPKNSDSVELRLTVPMSDRSRAGEALGADPLDGQIRQVY
jgi:hypothetical protein